VRDELLVLVFLLSTQYSFTRPASISPLTAATMPWVSHSQAPRPSVGKTSAGRPQWP
jgi:hypothetical protein